MGFRATLNFRKFKTHDTSKSKSWNMLDTVLSHIKAADLSNVSQPVRSKQVAKFLRVNRLAIKILAVELKCRGLQSKL